MMSSSQALCRLAIFGSVLALAACTGTKPSGKSAEAVLVPGDPTAPSQVAPSESLSIAASYAKHSWRPFARNILHGADKAGVLSGVFANRAAFDKTGA